MKNSGDFSLGSKVWPGTSKLIEEMGELQQVLGKLLGTAGQVEHWDGSNLRKRLVEEIADVLAALELFSLVNLTDVENQAIVNRMVDKIQLFCAWHKKEK